jgi:hypothetical protein
MLTTTISPLKQSRKRNRTEQVEQPIKEMELDENKEHLKAISDLTLEQLQACQKIAVDQLRSSLFLTVELGPEPSSKNPFQKEVEMQEDYSPFLISSPSEVTQFAPLLYSVSELFLKQRPNPSIISLQLDMTDKSQELKDRISRSVNEIVIERQDTLELARIIVYILRETPDLIPPNLKIACQGILAINQAGGLGRKIEGTNIKSPNSMVKSLIRNVLLLLAPLSRQLLQFIINFCCRLCSESTPKQRNSWARQLSSVFAYLLSSYTSTNVRETWAVFFFELLLHAHGLHVESHLKLENREIWCIDEAYQQEIQQRKLTRTPLRRSRNNLTTPRKSISRNGLINTPIGASLKRNLFRPLNSEPPSILS